MKEILLSLLAETFHEKGELDEGIMGEVRKKVFSFSKGEARNAMNLVDGSAKVNAFIGALRGAGLLL